ncbi:MULTISPECIES: hypothetical protein [Okeania]|uniref:hypothetical protein n=1 Tax=Okeania TaxID=1458928 RepID=UPI000F5332EF|nr:MULTISPECIES: hypothetical protein [Okeania]NEP03598.1 hypothetical protein [Okeania sp. SIO4D6]NET12066.1 hypothetical protein [Okeania sp. SIO1H6]NEP74462.1 hypothetical protein [Okeania sp. SIO2G5]NEP94620.1 hypothetical protein [Okeania sp. SIO2F5]NEQ91578.1 hypothetical protein [Okeania sp. SIO2G4]
MLKFSSTVVEAKVRTYKPTFRTTKCIIIEEGVRRQPTPNPSCVGEDRSQNLGENHSYRD